VLHGADGATFMDVFNIYFSKTAMFLSLVVGTLTVVSGAIYLWDSRDLYMVQA